MSNWDGPQATDRALVGREMDRPILSPCFEAETERSGDLPKVTQHMAEVRDLGSNPDSFPYQQCDPRLALRPLQVSFPHM